MTVKSRSLSAGFVLVVLVAVPSPWWPVVGTVGAGAWLSRWWRRRREVARRAQVDVEILARSLMIAFAGGLSLPVALEEARPLLGHAVGGEVESLIRAARRSGFGPVLASRGGPHTSELFLRLAAAQASGAPLARGVEAFLERTRIEDRARMLTRARTLPTRLIVPVALLILPGLVLLMLGPLFVNRLGGLVGPLVGG